MDPSTRRYVANMATNDIRKWRALRQLRDREVKTPRESHDYPMSLEQTQLLLNRNVIADDENEAKRRLLNAGERDRRLGRIRRAIALSLDEGQGEEEEDGDDRPEPKRRRGASPSELVSFHVEEEPGDLFASAWDAGSIGSIGSMDFAPSPVSSPVTVPTTSIRTLVGLKRILDSDPPDVLAGLVSDPPKTRRAKFKRARRPTRREIPSGKIQRKAGGARVRPSRRKKFTLAPQDSTWLFHGDSADEY